MAQISVNQLTGFLAFGVKNNPDGIKAALLKAGYAPATTSVGLVNQLVGIQQSEGFPKLLNVLNNVPINAGATSVAELNSINEHLTGVVQSATAKSFWDTLGSLVGGGSTTVGAGSSSTTTTKSGVSSTTIVIVVLVVAVAAFALYKWA